MSELISATKNQLERIVPDARKIVIKVERDHGAYFSRLHIHVPGRVLHAEKKGQTVLEALDSSYEAMLKQIQKFKARRKAKSKLIFDY
ncbi:MAG TPA: HPF/RaiA family ribosome-associated protein [Bacteriovoracaceae bacterium]|nr:HPF/RaiA family ribosome-associated protein [Bacteriovoracaceae bacterium]